MGGGVLNIKYKRIFKLFFFVVIFFVLIGICATFKTYAAVKKYQVFSSCNEGWMFGYKDVVTGKTGKATTNAAWVKKPTSHANAVKTSHKIKVTTTSGTVGNIKWTVKGGTYSSMNKESFKNTHLYGTYKSASYYYIRIPIDITVPAGYFWNGNITNSGLGTTRFSRDYRTVPEAGDWGVGNLYIKQYFTITQNQERTISGYMVGNIAALGLMTDSGGSSNAYTSASAMLKSAGYNGCSWFEFQYMPYNVEYKPGSEISGSEYIDKKYVGQSSTLRGKTYTKKHYQQVGWTGYTQYAKNINDTAKTCEQGKHYEEYNLNQSISAPGYSEDGYFRRHQTGHGDDFGCDEATLNEATESKIVLEPKWEADSYTIKYDPNGGKLKSGVTEADCTQKVKYDNGDKLRDYEPYIENPYGRFNGWSTDPTGTRILQPGDSIDDIDVENNGNITLYAIWDTRFNFRFLAYDKTREHVGAFANGKDGKLGKHNIGDVLDPLDSSFIPELYGHRFAGFYTRTGLMFFDSKGNPVNVRGTIKNNQIIDTIDDGITLYAKYTKITNASCSEDSATIPNIPVNPPSESGGPASENLHLKILKKDQNTEKLLDGAVFTLQGMGSNSDFSVERTTVYGVANFDLSNAKAGEYKLTETKAPDGYKTSDSSCPWTFTLEVNTVTDSKGVKHEIRRVRGIKDKNGEKVNTPTLTDDSYNCTIYNTSKKQTIKITKKDSKTGEPLTGAVFRLTGPNGQNEERRVDISGVVKFEDLEPGDYELKETTVPVGYILSGKIYAVKVTENDVTITEK